MAATAAIYGVGFCSFSDNLSTKKLIKRRGNGSIIGVRSICSRREVGSVVRCSSSSKAVAPLESEGDGRRCVIEEEEEEGGGGDVMRFKMSDFKVLDRVSIGLGGRADEVVFEAIVKDSNSPLHNIKVVLRKLVSTQAKRRGMRAIEVLKKLVRRKLMYHSYSMQVYGYISSPTSGRGSFTLVHGYHGSFSLRHWLQQSDWLPTLEATLALDEDSVRRVGDDTVGGSAVSRQLRITRILMRDLLIGVNYLHSHGLAHTELRLENVHISPVDRHIKVGILGNAADFYEDGPNSSTMDNNMDRRQMMIAFDMRCVGFMMAKMVVRELMDPLIFLKFKSFLMKGNDPSCLREFLLQILSRNSPSGNVGLQILDRNWGAGWNLLSLLLATKPSKRISCLDALRHPFLCGPRWRVAPSMDIIRWGLGSTAVRITEEYIYKQPQRNRLSYFIELMEMLNAHSRPKNWLELLPGKWRLLYCTGRQIGLTLRQPSARVLIGDVYLTINRASKLNTSISFTSDIGFTVMNGRDWPHDKSGITGKLEVNSLFRLTSGRRLYLKEEKTSEKLSFGQPNNQDSLAQKLSAKKWRKLVPHKEFPSSLPVAKLVSADIEVTMSLGDNLNQNDVTPSNIVHELRVQVPPEMFDLSRLVCGTYVDSRLLVLRGVNGSALLFTRSMC
ncbi:probable plastid-lipid-associated protein 14, chloroplastic isoform X1 [Populus alba]|uniref:Putative plastid-lipid-associated protein 14, chloroplastic n=1 Tax=Populus alba TaxID=43335 RepID=A0A4U5R0X7_POPAL|nr:probable plastid-lipid-associated protein 14, chloroplastic [Populus alba]TKS17343.1 putative plastid-lipid-associated protein 14, chloroplastic [Populus alba]